MKCALCGKEISGHGNNGEPLVKGRVCDSCNWKVILERLHRVKVAEKPETEPEKPATENLESDSIAKYQKEVDTNLGKFGRIGGKLYDELDDNGLWYDLSDGKVKRKVERKTSNESIADTGVDDPAPEYHDPMADFEKYAKEFEETFILADTPVRKENAENKVKESNGTFTGEVKSEEKGQKMEQVEV